MLLEERGLREEDWNDILGSREAAKFASNSAPASSLVSSSSKTASSSVAKNEQETENKKKNGKSNKQASKLESSIAKLEKQLLEIDDNMAKFFKDGNKMSELKKQRKEIQSKLDDLFEKFSTL